MHHPTSLPRPHAQLRSSAPTFIQPSGVRSPSPPAFKTESTKKTKGDLGMHHRPQSHGRWKASAVARPGRVRPCGAGTPVPHFRNLRSSSPTGSTGESDEDLWSDADESEVADPSDGEDGDDDEGLISSRMMSLSLDRSGRTGSVSVQSGSDGVRAPRPRRLSAPVPEPNLTRKSRGRRVPTAPVFMVQRGVQKNMRMYRCTVDGCYKCFARGEHLKRHVRSIHTNGEA